MSAPADKVREELRENGVLSTETADKLTVCYTEIRSRLTGLYLETRSSIADDVISHFQTFADEFLKAVPEAALASRNQTIKRVRYIVTRSLNLGLDVLAELDRELGAGEGRDYE